MRAVGACIALLASPGVSVAGGPEPKQVRLDERFELRLGESARIEGAGLEIGFEAVLGDSRCPKGVQCVWEGDAGVRVRLRREATQDEQRCELHTSPKRPGTCAEPDLRLVGLAPYPVAGRKVAKSDYAAAFRMAPSAESSAVQ